MIQNALLKILTEAKKPIFNKPEDLFIEIKNAYHQVIKLHVPPSPLVPSLYLSELTGAEVWLKLESLNPTGSFKVRGALNALKKFIQVNSDIPHHQLKVCAASAGNHAQGVAFAAKTLGVQAHIFLPTTAPIVKKQATESLGAKVYSTGNSLEEAFVAAQNFAEKEKAHLLHAYNDFDVILGQATCSYEAIMQWNNELEDKQKINELFPYETYESPDIFLCSLGGGGLAAGCSVFLDLLGSKKPHMIGVQQEYYNSAIVSRQQQQQLPSPEPNYTIADGIAVRMIGNLNFNYLEKYVDELDSVNDDWISQAILMLCEKEHIVTEGAGAAAVACLLKNPRKFRGKKVIACVSGGNIDPELLTRTIARGLSLKGRLLRFSACVKDRPGQLLKLLKVLAELECNVLDLIHDRTYSEVNAGYVEIELCVETKNKLHQDHLMASLKEQEFFPRIRH